MSLVCRKNRKGDQELQGSQDFDVVLIGELDIAKQDAEKIASTFWIRKCLCMNLLTTQGITVRVDAFYQFGESRRLMTAISCHRVRHKQ